MDTSNANSSSGTGIRILSKIVSLFFIGGLLIGLVAIDWENYLLFHSFVELFTAGMAFSIFLVMWNCRQYLNNNYLLLMGISMFFIGIQILLHSLAYKGMGVFPENDANFATQLWISKRYVLSLSFLIAPLLLGRNIRAKIVFFVYSILFALIALSIFEWRNFPTCYVEGQGLTPFKIYSEYIISLFFILSMAMLYAKRRYFDRNVMILILASLAMAVLAEIIFTLYISVYGLINAFGHIIALGSYVLLYKAIVETGLTKPYDLLFRDLKNTASRLRQARDELDLRVRERTADLAEALENLQCERQRLFAVLNMLPGYVALKTSDYQILFANHRYIELFGVIDHRPCYAVQQDQDQPCEGCPIPKILETRQPAKWEWTCPTGRTYNSWGYPFSDMDGSEIILETGIDITDRKKLQREVIHASETERRSLGRDLHDTLGQNLTGLGFLVEGLSNKLFKNFPEDQGMAKQIQQLVQDSISQVRTLSRGLDPIGLHKEGLAASLRELAKEIESLYGISCRCQFDHELVIYKQPVAIHLYRIVQEAINNAMRHGKAKNIDISLKTNDLGITLKVEDDGVGLPDMPIKGKGMGMHTMQYRAEVIGGIFSLHSGPQRGVIVSCFIPDKAMTKINKWSDFREIE